MKRFNRVGVVQISDESALAMATLAGSNMPLRSMIKGGKFILSSAEHEALIKVDL